LAASPLVVVGLLAAAPAFAAPIPNGGFETPSIGGSTFVPRSTGFDFGDWTVAAGSVDQIGTSLWAGADGGQSVQLIESTPGTLCQTFSSSTVGNGGVSFSMSHNPSLAHGQLQVVVNGVAVGTFTHSTANSTADMKWETHSVAFPVSGPTTQLCFRATAASTASGDYPVIDAVSLGAPPVLLGQFDGSTSGHGTFSHPEGVAVDPSSGDVYVSDEGNHVVQRFSGAGRFVSQFDGTGTSFGQFLFLIGVAVEPSSGDVYVADFSKSAVGKFTPGGTLVTQFGTFHDEAFVAVAPSSGEVYVTDDGDNNVQRFQSDGTFVNQFGSTGTGDGMFDPPEGVAVDPSGDVYVADEGQSRVEKFRADGTFVSQFAGPRNPYGVAVDPSSHDVYVTDQTSDLVQSFTPGGVVLAQFGGSGAGGGRGGDAVDPLTGVVYVTDVNSRRVDLFGTAPVVSGATVDGGTVYASRPSQVGRGPFTYTYQWLDCPFGGGACVDNGAPRSSNGLRLVASDIGKTIEVAVTQTSSAGTVGPVTSVAVGPVKGAPPVNQSSPVVSGSTADGGVVTATHGSWTGLPVTSYSYQWQSCSGGTCSNVGTNASGYRLAPGDVGHTIRVLVSATNPDGMGGPATSGPVGPVTASPPVDTTVPAITGTYAIGSRLIGSAGTWTGVLPISYAYQWQRCPAGTPASCVDIPGATINNYRLTAADTHVRLVVKATNADGGPVTATSALAG
jgi:DNA-binding beta-propeller fold protein YncE